MRSMKSNMIGTPALALSLVLLISGAAAAQDLIVYPGKNQSPEQQQKDEFECYSWAKQNSGFDPMQQPRATSAPPQQQAQQGGVVRGGARGAAVGAVGGAIGGNAGKGAAIGAASGALIGGMRRRDQQRKQQQAEQQWAQQQAAQYQAGRDAYNRAYGACLDGRGYTVR